MKVTNWFKKVFQKTHEKTALVRGYWSDESGQTSTEYILLIVVVVALISKFKGALTDKLGGLIDRVFGQEVDKILGGG